MERKDINNKNVENLPNVLKEQKGVNVFEVPENYFEGFRNNLYKNISVTKPTNPFVKIVKTNAFIYAAAASIVGILIISSIFISNNETNFNSPNTNPHISKIDTITPTNYEKIILTDNEIIKKKDNNSNKKQDIIIKDDKTNDIKVNGLKNNIASSNKTIDIVNPISDNKKNNGNERELNKELNSNNSLITNNQIIADNNLNSKNSSEEKATIKQNFKQINLFPDTCALDKLIIEAPKSNKKEYYLWSNGSINKSLTIEKSGKYWLKISNNKSFEEFIIDSFNVQIIPTPNPSIEENILICSFESIKISSNCTNKNYNYYWNISDKNQPEIIISNLSPGHHNISLEVEACNQVFNAESVIIVKNCNLDIPNVITPNGDGHNDYFVIDGLENYPNASLYIMDRNGKTVYESNNYQNNWGAENLEIGTYYYLLRLNDENKTEKGGIISVLR